MNKRNPIVVFKGEVTGDDLRIISKEFSGDVVINGNVCIDYDLKFDGRLFVNGSCDISGDVRVKELICTAEAFFGNVKVDGDIFCKEFNAIDVTVRGNIICQDVLNAADVEVGGDLFCKDDFNANHIKVVGNLYCEGNCDIISAKIGENLCCKGCFDSGSVNVGKIV